MTPTVESQQAGADTTSAPQFDPVRRIGITVAICSLTLLGFFLFPGHTFLQSDTQIYLPILEHIVDPQVLARDPVAIHPHVAYTIFDEASVALRALTRSGFEQALTIQQIAFRALGLLGVFWIAASLGLGVRMSLLVTSVFSLGATIVGPAVLSIEYEPVPRGFALGLVMLALGLVAQRLMIPAALAGAVAMLYHAPTVLPFWALFSVLEFLRMRRRPGARQGALALAIFAGTCLTLLLVARLQAGGAESQHFFSRITAEQEKLMRLRVPYVWVSIWGSQYLGTYLVLWAIGAAAVWRLWTVMSVELRVFAIGLPLIGMVAMPVSWLLLEQGHWALIPQMQPARAVLFVTVFAIILCASAGARAGLLRRPIESFFWFAVAFAPAAHPHVFELFRPVTPVLRLRLNILVALAMLAAIAARLEVWRRVATIAGVAAVAILAAWSIPVIGAVHNYPYLHDPQVYSLAAWAQSSTPADSVFHFPDAGHDLYPGIFRARSLRAVFVDWKGGGQMNFLRPLGDLWWSRWRLNMTEKVTAADLVQYGTLGVDYVVLRAQHRVREIQPAYQNSKFVVYRLRPDELVLLRPRAAIARRPG